MPLNVRPDNAEQADADWMIEIGGKLIDDAAVALRDQTWEIILAGDIFLERKCETTLSVRVRYDSPNPSIPSFQPTRVLLDNPKRADIRQLAESLGFPIKDPAPPFDAKEFVSEFTRKAEARQLDQLEHLAKAFLAETGYNPSEAELVCGNGSDGLPFMYFRKRSKLADVYALDLVSMNPYWIIYRPSNKDFLSGDKVSYQGDLDKAARFSLADALECNPGGCCIQPSPEWIESVLKINQPEVRQ